MKLSRIGKVTICVGILYILMQTYYLIASIAGMDSQGVWDLSMDAGLLWGVVAKAILIPAMWIGIGILLEIGVLKKWNKGVGLFAIVLVAHFLELIYNLFNTYDYAANYKLDLVLYGFVFVLALLLFFDAGRLLKAVVWWAAVITFALRVTRTIVTTCVILNKPDITLTTSVWSVVLVYIVQPLVLFASVILFSRWMLFADKEKGKNE